jgi:hypothetical protein
MPDPTGSPSTTKRIVDFLKAEPCGPPGPPTASEIMDFKKSCTDDEWRALAAGLPDAS